MVLKPPFQQVKKRDGRITAFEVGKIEQALVHAGEASGEFGIDQAKSLACLVLDLAEKLITDEIPTVEQVQDLVEETLLSSHYKKTAKAYIIYRDQHAKMRELVENASVDLVDNYLGKLDWQVKENSNMSYSLQGLNNYISSEINKRYWLNKIYPPAIGAAHHSADIHIHDLSLLAVYCVGWDLEALITKGFRGATGKIESKAPKHFRSALGQVVNFFYTLQGEAAGAQAFSSFDTLLAPFIRYDKLEYKEVKQALQEFVFNINVPTRVGFQTPFTNVTLDLQPPKIYRDQPAIIGGEPQNETYADFQAEMDMFNRAFLEVMADGDAKGRVFTFPIPTYNITKDFDWDNENLELLWEVTAKYGVPYFANFINSDMSPDDARSMCCRLRLDNRELRKRGGGLFGANPLTGSIGVVTINLPRIGFTSKNQAEFMAQIDKLMDLAKESLEIKRKVLEQLTDKDLYPYSKYYLRDVKTRFDQHWANHFSTIGLVGMNEACLNLLGETIDQPAAHAFAQEVLTHMRNRLQRYQEETGHYYNLEATPAEGTAYRLAKIDKARFGTIICANEAKCQKGAKPYYTNSTHLPVGFTDDIFTALDLQDPLQSLYTGGTVLHGFLGESMPSAEATKQLVKTALTNYNLPYLTLSPTFSVCPNHGYLRGEHQYCPKCDQEIGYTPETAEEAAVDGDSLKVNLINSTK